LAEAGASSAQGEMYVSTFLRLSPHINRGRIAVGAAAIVIA